MGVYTMQSIPHCPVGQIYQYRIAYGIAPVILLIIICRTTTGTARTPSAPLDLKINLIFLAVAIQNVW